MKSKSIALPTPPNQTLEKTLTITLKERASTLVADIKERFQTQITRLKSIFKKPQPEDFLVVDLEKGPEQLEEEVEPKLKPSKSEVLIPKLQIGKKILKQSTNLGLNRQNTNRSTQRNVKFSEAGATSNISPSIQDQLEAGSISSRQPTTPIIVTPHV
jgi:hypothetical protein